MYPHAPGTAESSLSNVQPESRLSAERARQGAMRSRATGLLGECDDAREGQAPTRGDQNFDGARRVELPPERSSDVPDGQS
jgi:hypothetical protein